MANKASDILGMIKDKEIEWVDLRFTDPKGKWQHLTMASGVIDEDMLDASPTRKFGEILARRALFIFQDDGGWDAAAPPPGLHRVGLEGRRPYQLMAEPEIRGKPSRVPGERQQEERTGDRGADDIVPGAGVETRRG